MSPATPDHLDTKEREDKEVYRALQEPQDSQLLGVEASQDLQASREMKV